VTSAVRPFSSLAFGVLVPVSGLGLMGLWGARYGTFPPRGGPESEPARKAERATNADNETDAEVGAPAEPAGEESR
jgi:hypothetical protein